MISHHLPMRRFAGLALAANLGLAVNLAHAWDYPVGRTDAGEFSLMAVHDYTHQKKHGTLFLVIVSPEQPTPLPAGASVVGTDGPVIYRHQFVRVFTQCDREPVLELIANEFLTGSLDKVGYLTVPPGSAIPTEKGTIGAAIFTKACEVAAANAKAQLEVEAEGDEDDDF